MGVRFPFSPSSFPFSFTLGIESRPLPMLSVAGIGFQKQFHLTVQVDLKLVVFLLLLPEGWDYKCAPLATTLGLRGAGWNPGLQAFEASTL